jgi:hypothetical protein
MTIENGRVGVLVAEYVLHEPGTFEMGDVVVTYGSGLHRREQMLGMAACLTTAADTSTCATR